MFGYEEQEEQEQNDKFDEFQQQEKISVLGTPIHNQKCSTFDSQMLSQFSQLNITHRSDYQGINNLGTGLTSSFQNMAVTEPHYDSDDESMTAQLNFMKGELDQQHQIASEIRFGCNKKLIKKQKRRFSFLPKKKQNQ